MRDLFFLDKKPSWWARLWAKAIDYCLFYLIFTLSSMVFPFYIEDLYYLGFAFFIPILWAPFEAFCISRLKTTLGKALLGIRIETHLGGRLPFWLALKRSLFLGTLPGIIRQRSGTKMRALRGFTILCVLLGGAVFEKEIAVVTTGFEKYRTVDGWKEYVSTEGNFSVIFPQEPEYESGVLPVPSQKKNLTYNEFKSYQTKKVYYSVSYIDLPRKWKMAGASRLLQGALELILEHTPGSQLLSQNMTKHQNLRALDFHLSQGEEEVQGRLILVGTTLFRLTAVYPPALAHQLQHEEFVNSFQVHS